MIQGGHFCTAFQHDLVCSNAFQAIAILALISLLNPLLELLGGQHVYILTQIQLCYLQLLPLLFSRL